MCAKTFTHTMLLASSAPERRIAAGDKPTHNVVPSAPTRTRKAPSGLIASVTPAVVGITDPTFFKSVLKMEATRAEPLFQDYLEVIGFGGYGMSANASAVFGHPEHWLELDGKISRIGHRRCVNHVRRIRRVPLPATEKFHRPRGDPLGVVALSLGDVGIERKPTRTEFDVEHHGGHQELLPLVVGDCIPGSE